MTAIATVGGVRFVALTDLHLARPECVLWVESGPPMGKARKSQLVTTPGDGARTPALDPSCSCDVEKEAGVRPAANLPFE